MTNQIFLYTFLYMHLFINQPNILLNPGLISKLTIIPTNHLKVSSGKAEKLAYVVSIVN